MARIHITDDNYHQFVGDGETVEFGGRRFVLAARPELRCGDVSLDLGLEDVGIKVIPRSEWDERIRIHEANGSDLGRLFQAPPLDQAETSYCWVNCVAHAIEAAMVAAGMQWVRLSPASVGALIKNYQNVGGWPDEAMEYAAKHGIAPASLWPPNAIDRRYDNEQTRRERVKYGPVKYWLHPKSAEETATLLLLGIPVCVGLLWWRHAVVYLALRKDDAGNYVWLALNSWGERFGENGRFTLSWTRGIPDEATALYFPKIDSLKAA